MASHLSHNLTLLELKAAENGIKEEDMIVFTRITDCNRERKKKLEIMDEKKHSDDGDGGGDGDGDGGGDGDAAQRTRGPLHARVRGGRVRGGEG